VRERGAETASAAVVLVGSAGARIESHDSESSGNALYRAVCTVFTRNHPHPARARSPSFIVVRPRTTTRAEIKSNYRAGAPNNNDTITKRTSRDDFFRTLLIVFFSSATAFVFRSIISARIA